MPNRIIKESLCDSEKVAKMSDFQFRLWIGLITQADDAGRGDARPAILKGRIFPLREQVTTKQIETALRELATIGSVILYEVGGKPYYAHKHWSEHQRIRDVKPKYPAPEEGVCQSAADCGELPQIAAGCGLNPIQSNTNQNQNPNTKVCACGRPSLEEIEAYAAEKHLDVDAKAFFDYFTETGWVDSKGNKVKSWKGKLQTWSNFGSGRSGKQAASYADVTVDMAELSRTLGEI